MAEGTAPALLRTRWTALKDAPESSYPMYRLPHQVEEAVRAARKGEKPEAIHRAVRQAVRTVLFAGPY